MTTPNPIKLVFTEEQLANLNALVERETKHAFDEIAEGIARATQEFAECFADIPLPDGTTLELHSPEWEEWAQRVDELVSIMNFQVEGFDANAYYRKQQQTRLATSN